MATVTLRSGIASTTNNGVVTSASFTPTVGELLVVVAMHSGKTTAPVIAASANGITFTQFNGSMLKNASADSMTFWVANQLVPASPSAMTVSSTPTNSSGGLLFVASVTGLTRTGLSAIRQGASQGNQAAASTPAPVFANPALAGNPLLGAVFNGTNPATMTPPTGWTETATIGDIGYATPTSGGEAVFLSAGDTATTHTWGGTSASAFCSGCLELDISALQVASGSVNVTASVSAAANVERPVDGTQTGTAALAAAATLTISVDATRTASASLSAAAALTSSVAGTRTGAASLSAAVALEVALSASLTSTATLASETLLTKGGAAVVSGIANLAATAAAELQTSATSAVSADLSGASALSLSVDATTSSSASLSSAAFVDRLTTAALAVASDLVGTVTLTVAASVALSASGDLVASGDVLGPGDIAGDLVVAADRAATMTLVGVAAADLAGGSDVSVSATLGVLDSADLVGAGGLVASGAVIAVAGAALSGATDVQAASVLVVAALADLIALSDLQAMGGLLFAGAADLMGDGVLVLGDPIVLPPNVPHLRRPSASIDGGERTVEVVKIWLPSYNT